MQAWTSVGGLVKLIYGRSATWSVISSHHLRSQTWLVFAGEAGVRVKRPSANTRWCHPHHTWGKHTTTCHMSPPRMMLKHCKISIFIQQQRQRKLGCLVGRVSVSLEGKCILRREPQNCLDYDFLWLISDHFDSGLYQDEKLSGSWHFSIKIWICKNSQNSRELGFACTRWESLKIMILPLIPEFLLVMAINLGSDFVFRTRVRLFKCH